MSDTPATTQKTPGQAACEAMRAKAIEQSAAPLTDFATWDELAPWQHERFEAAATAAREDLTAQLDGIRARLDSLAADLEHSAVTSAPSRKSEIENAIAGRLREIADRPF